MGEIVIPPEVLTPALMDELRRIYRAEGLDFERYVVGGPVGPDGDSLNPVTGLREYFYAGDEDFTDTDFSFADEGSSGTPGDAAGDESYPADNDENNTRADELRSIAAEAAYNAAHAGRSASETGDDSYGDYGGGGGTEDSSIREAETRTNDPATLGETRRPGVTPGATPPGQQDARNDPSQPPGIGPNRTAAQDDRPFAQSAQGPGANLGPRDPDKTGQRTDRSGQPAAPGSTATQTVTRTGPASGRSLGRAPGGQGADASTGGGGGRTANRSGDPSADPASPDYKAGSVGAARGMEAEAYDFVSMYSERNSGLIGWTAEDVDRVAAEMEGRHDGSADPSSFVQLSYGANLSLGAIGAMNKGLTPGTEEFKAEVELTNLEWAIQDMKEGLAALRGPGDTAMPVVEARNQIAALENQAEELRDQLGRGQQSLAGRLGDTIRNSQWWQNVQKNWYELEAMAKVLDAVREKYLDGLGMPPRGYPTPKPDPMLNVPPKGHEAGRGGGMGGGGEIPKGMGKRGLGKKDLLK